MCDVLGNYALWVSESVLGTGKGNSMLLLVLSILIVIPIKARICHERILALGNIKSHTAVWRR